jgi:choline kinase
MNVIILAAGFGSRLKPLTNNVPKPLLLVGNKSLLQYKIDSLRSMGFNDQQIVVVVGYLKEKIIASFPTITFIENKEFATTNNLYSLWLAKEYVKGGFILLNGDTWHSPHIFETFFSQGNRDFFNLSSFIGIDSSKKKSDDLCAAVDEKGSLIKVDFNIKYEDCAGKSVQFSWFNATDTLIFFKYIEDCLSRKEFSIGANIIPSDVMKKMNVKIIDVKGLPWLEIDTLADFETAQKVIS